MTAQRHLDQVALLLRTLPKIASEPDFALKGGTAINLFVRDLPRLSVDIDLVYLPVADRMRCAPGSSGSPAASKPAGRAAARPAQTARVIIYDPVR